MIGIVFAAIFLVFVGLGICALVGGLVAVAIRRFWPNLEREQVARFSGAPMPVAAGLLIVAFVISPIGVDDNGPQIMGGIILLIGAMGVAAFGFFVGRGAAHFVLRRAI